MLCYILSAHRHVIILYIYILGAKQCILIFSTIPNSERVNMTCTCSETKKDAYMLMYHPAL